MSIEIHGKKYKTVAERVAEFREEFMDGCISTKVVSADDDRVVMKAFIRDADGKLLSTGYAEEERGSSNINKTSALENCETSAVGRALAFHLYAGTEIASADEVANAIKQQHEKAIFEEWAVHTQFVERYREGLENIRDRLADNDFEAAREAWNTLHNETIGSDENKRAQSVLWRATSKGGWFTTRERQQMKYWSNEFDTKIRRQA